MELSRHCDAVIALIQKTQSCGVEGAEKGSRSSAAKQWNTLSNGRRWEGGSLPANFTLLQAPFHGEATSTNWGLPMFGEGARLK